MGELYNPFPKLPKNIRQIGEGDSVVRLYLEDYVNTYLKRLYPTGKQTLRAGLLLGTMEQHDGTPYIFVDGAMEMEDVETDGEKIVFSENTWKKAYQSIEEQFPKRTIQGWFLCGAPGSQLSPLNYWKQHNQFFAGKNQLMYLNQGLEGEEAIYITSEDGFYKLRGHNIYYERNQMMQDYMITRKDVHRIESGSHEQVIRDFRQRMVNRKEQAGVQSSRTSALGMLCGVLSVAVLAGGVVLFNNYQKMQQMESVLTSVLPAGVAGWDEYQKQKAEEPDFIIEELPGNIYPTENMTGETGETFKAGSETMSSEDPFGGTGQDKTVSAKPEGQAAVENIQVNGQDAAGNTQTGGNPESSAAPQGGSGQESVPQGDGKDASLRSGSQDTGSVQDSGQETAGTAQTGGAQVNVLGSDDGIQEAEPVIGASGSGQNSSEAARQTIVGMGKESGQGDEGDSDYIEETHPPIDYEAAAANGYRIYEVGEGETLYGICWNVYGNLGRLKEICKLNYLTDEDRILAGQKLILP